MLNPIVHPLVKAVRRTCIAAPEQYEGELHSGESFYFRLRGGRASVGIGRTVDAAADDPGTAVMAFQDPFYAMFDTPEERDSCFDRLLRERLEATEGEAVNGGNQPV